MPEQIFSDEPLHPDLVPYVREDGPVGQYVHHPLVVSLLPVWSIANRQYEFKVRALKEAEESGNFLRQLMLHERPYRLDLVCQWVAEDVADGDTLKELLLTAWKDAEYPGDSALDAFRALGFMSDSWQPPYEGRVRIYRGGHPDGISWTVSKEVADRFAQRWDDQQPVWQGYVDGDDICALIWGRDEFEVVVDPDYIEELEEVDYDAND